MSLYIHYLLYLDYLDVFHLCLYSIPCIQLFLCTARTCLSAQLVYYLLLFNVFFGTHILILFYLFCHLRPLCNLGSSKTLQSKAKMPKKTPIYLFIYFAARVEIFTKTCRQEIHLQFILSKNLIWLIPFFFRQLYLKYFIPTWLASQRNSAVPSATEKAEKSSDKVNAYHQVCRRHVLAFCDIWDPQEVKWATKQWGNVRSMVKQV